MADRAYQLPPQPLRYRWETAGRWQIERTSYHQPLVTVLSFLQSWSIRLRGVIADSLSLTTQRNRGFSVYDFGKHHGKHPRCRSCPPILAALSKELHRSRHVNQRNVQNKCTNVRSNCIGLYTHNTPRSSLRTVEPRNTAHGARLTLSALGLAREAAAELHECRLYSHKS